MSALADAPTLFDRVECDELPRRVPGPATSLGGEPTLDDLLSGAWEELTAHQPVTCLVCGDVMSPAYAANARPVGGSCRGCGSSLT